jgi:4-aminobutyrate aminotransferase-like enzyme
VSVGSFTSAARVDLLARLTRILPNPITRVQLYSGGAEAVEAALRLARSHTGGHEVLGFWGGFHGKTGGVIGLTSSRRGLGPVAPGTLLTPYADCYRCPFGATYPSCGLLCVEHARDTLKNASTGQLAAVIAEPVQGTAGNVIPPPGFLPGIREVAREAGALFIADEMITGFGRTGRLFAVEHEQVQPDVMTLGKALGGGYPISALAASDAVLTRGPFIEPSASSSSYGGNPLAAAAAAASVAIVVEEDLSARAASLGAHLLERMRSWPDRFACVGEVRGRGLLIGVELVADRRTRAPLGKDPLRKLFLAALRRGVLTMMYAPRWRINPPLVVSQEQADEALDILEEVLTQAGTGRLDGEPFLGAAA